MTKEEYKQHNCPMCGFKARAKTNEEVLEHAKYHMAHAHGVIEVRLRWPRKLWKPLS